MAKIKPNLVRDNIPDIIRGSGGKPVTRKANDDEFIGLLKEKAVEEAKEFLMADNENKEMGELVDLLEVLNTYMKVKELSADALEVIRKRKLKEAGGFRKRIVLEGTK